MSPIYNYVQQYLRLSPHQLTQLEHQFLIHIETIAPIDPLERNYFYSELFHGAFVFIPDNGATYQLLTSYDQNNLVSRNYSSSHYSMEPQYGFRGSLVGECLFGTKIIDDEKGSWIQLEAYSTDLFNAPGHLISYINYLFTGYNQGPYGSSIHTECNPILLNLDDPSKPSISQPMVAINIVEHETTISDHVTPITMSDVFIDISDQYEQIHLESLFIESQTNETPQVVAPTFEPIKVEIIPDQMIIIEPVIA
ncbi:MAG: hypothetical protein HYX61_01920 [Gammaproteobacteria bacterium]|jgi:hypothetical protein|nr:hypothetical protein [Gammaproteobacteria bacterium]